MRKKNYKGRCEKKYVSKCDSICKTYDPIQAAYVDLLDSNPGNDEIKCNVILAIDTIAVENEVADNMYQRSELDYLIYNDPVAYADLILNGDPETHLKTVTEYKPLDS